MARHSPLISTSPLQEFLCLAEVLCQRLFRCLAIFDARDGIFNWICTFIDHLQALMCPNNCLLSNSSKMEFVLSCFNTSAFPCLQLIDEATPNTCYKCKSSNQLQNVLQLRQEDVAGSLMLSMPLPCTKATRKTSCEGKPQSFAPSLIIKRTGQPLMATTVAMPSACKSPQPRLGVKPAPWKANADADVY